MKKRMCAISIVLMFLYAVLSFIPGMLESEYWVMRKGDIGYRMRSTDSANMYQATGNILSWIILILVVVAIIALIRLCTDGENSFTDAALYAPIAALAVYLFFGIECLFLGWFTKYDSNWFYDYKLSWGYILGVGLLIPSAIICVMIVKGKFRDEEKLTCRISGNADELKKYKELLDSGAITAEEYERKKKQILEL